MKFITLFLATVSLTLFTACTQQSIQSKSVNNSPIERDPVQVGDGEPYVDPTLNQNPTGLPSSTTLKNSVHLELPDSISNKSSAPSISQKVDLKYDFLVDDVCISNRLKLKNRKIFYFIEYFLKDRSLVTDSNKYHESVVSVGFSEDKTVEDLRRILKTDPCLISITNRTTLRVIKTNSINLSQYVNHLDKIFFNQAAQFIKGNLDKTKKVRIAVIDSGIDFDSPSIGPVSRELAGTDYVEQDSIPQDILGHGTEVTSLISTKPGNSAKVQSLMGDYVEIIPIKLFGDSKSTALGMDTFHDAIKRAVNLKADIINMSFEAIIDSELDVNSNGQLIIAPEKAKSLKCPIQLGHSLKKAIDRGVFIVTSAGHGTSYEKYMSGEDKGKLKYFKQVNGREVLCDGKQEGCFPKPIPGPVFRMNDNGYNHYGNTSAPGCWSGHLKGLVSVASLDKNDNLSSFSNWGGDNTELATIGEGLKTLTLNNKAKLQQGTSFTAAIATSAAAMVISYHKNQAAKSSNPDDWHYSPWYVEDVLLNGSASLSSLQNGTPNQRQDLKIYFDRLLKNKDVPQSELKTRRGKIINLAKLSSYLTAMANMSPEERKDQETDNGEIGKGYLADSSNEMTGLQVYFKQGLASNKDRLQAQAVALYKNGSTKVITDQVSWSSDKNNVKVTTSGVVIPSSSFVGSVKISASLNNFSADATARMISGNIIAGGTSMVPEELQIKWLPTQSSCSYMRFQVLGLNNRSEKINYSLPASISSNKGTIINLNDSIMWNRPSSAKAGDSISLTALVYGKRAEFNFKAPTCTFTENNIVHTIDSVYENSPGALDNITGRWRGELRGKNITFKSPIGSKTYTMEAFCFVSFNPGHPGNCSTDSRYVKFGVGIKAGTEVIEKDLRILWTASPLTLRTKASINVPELQLQSLQFAKIDPSSTEDNFLNSSAHLKIEGIFSDNSKAELCTEEIVIEMRDKNGTPITNAYAECNSGNRTWSIFNFQNLDESDFTVTARFKGSDITVQKDFKAVIFKPLNNYFQSQSHTIKDQISNNGIQLSSGALVQRNQVINNKATSNLCMDSSKLGLEFAGGTGTKNDPYIVCNLAQLTGLQGISKHSTTINVKLGNHIDLRGYNLKKSIGAAVLDGNGYELRNINIIQRDAPTSEKLIDAVILKNIGFRNTVVHRKMTFLGFDTAIDVYFDNISLIEAKLAEASGFIYMNSFHMVNAEIRERTTLFPYFRGIWENSYIDVNAIGSALYSPKLIEQFIGGFNGIQNSTANGNSPYFTVPNAGGNYTSVKGSAFNNNYLVYKSVGAYNGAPINKMQNAVISNLVAEVDISSQGDKVGGLVGTMQSDRLSYSRFANLILNSDISGTVRAQDQVGGAVGVLNSGEIHNTNVKTTIVGRNKVGGLVGSYGESTQHAGDVVVFANLGYALIENNDVSHVTLTTSSNHSSDLIGYVSSKADRGALTSKAIYNTPLRIKNNKAKGNFLNSEQEELTRALNIILNQ